MILKYFEYSLEGQPSVVPLHKCCDYHKNICTCNVCSAERVKEVDLDLTKVVLRDDPTPSGCQHINLAELCNELTSYWLDIDYGRSCIGSTSLRPMEGRYQLTVKWAKIFICGNFSFIIFFKNCIRRNST